MNYLKEFCDAVTKVHVVHCEVASGDSKPANLIAALAELELAIDEWVEYLEEHQLDIHRWSTMRKHDVDNVVAITHPTRYGSESDGE